MGQSARQTEHLRPHSYTRTSRTSDAYAALDFSDFNQRAFRNNRRRLRNRQDIGPSHNFSRLMTGRLDLNQNGRALGTAVPDVAAEYDRNISTSRNLAFSDKNKDGLMEDSELDVETQYRELMGARAKRMKIGEYDSQHHVETIHLDADEDLRNYYTFTGEAVGTGTYGTVFAATSKQTGEEVAVKSMDKHTQPRYRREIEMLKRVNFKGVVRLLRVFESRDKVFLVTEYLDGGDLFDYIVDHNVYLENMSLRKALEITRAMLCSLEACHLNDFAHLDVKPENFVFRTSPEEYTDLVLVDFGASQPFRLKSFARGKQDYVGGMDDYWIGEPESHIGGTASYVSPEVVIQGRFSSRSDMWSMGVTLYMMLTGQRPFDAEVDSVDSDGVAKDVCVETAIQQKIRQEATRARNLSVFKTCEDLQGIDESIKRLLVEMTQPDPALRPSTTEAIHYIDTLLSGDLPGDDR